MYKVINITTQDVLSEHTLEVDAEAQRQRFIADGWDPDILAVVGPN
jgi:hypothetical protein